MATNYPGSIDDTTSLPNPGSSAFTNNPSHAGIHDNANDAIKALETKLGTSSSTPSASLVLRGTGTGTSAWGAVNLTTDVTEQLPVSGGGTGVGTISGIVKGNGTSAMTAAVAGTDYTSPSSTDTFSGAKTFNDGKLILAGATSGTTTLKASAVASGTLTLPAATDTLVGRATTDTLTNKSIDASTNTITNIGSSSVVAGFAVQQVSTTTTAVATGTTVIPIDDTIPQNTEGDQYMSLAITPKSSTDTLDIEVTIWLTHSLTNQNIAAAIFQDTTANALAVGWGFNPGAGAPLMLTFRHTMTAGTTSATTFKVRAGAGSAGTTTFNGSGGARFFGAITKSSMTITEYKA